MSEKLFDFKEASKQWPELIPLRRIEDLPHFPWKRETLRRLCSASVGVPMFQRIKCRIGPRLIYFERDELADAVQRYQAGER